TSRRDVTDHVTVPSHPSDRPTVLSASGRLAVSERGGRVRSKGETRVHHTVLTPGGDDLQMQYLVSVIDDKSNPGSTDRQPAISAFNERLIAEGYWVFAGGLADTTAATVIDNRGEQAVFSDGPFVESKEYLAG